MQLAVRVVVVGPVAVEEEDVVVLLVFQQLVCRGCRRWARSSTGGQDDLGPRRPARSCRGRRCRCGRRSVGIVLAVVVLVVPRLAHQARAVGRHEAGVHGVLVLADGESRNRRCRSPSPSSDGRWRRQPRASRTSRRRCAGSPSWRHRPSRPARAPGGVVLRDLALDVSHLLRWCTIHRSASHRRSGCSARPGTPGSCWSRSGSTSAMPSVLVSSCCSSAVTMGWTWGVHHVVGGSSLGLEGGHKQRGTCRRRLSRRSLPPYRGKRAYSYFFAVEFQVRTAVGS